MAILEVKDLSFQYADAERKALEGLSFSLSEGDYLAIIGHNGSGKSTLAKVLTGINPKFLGSIELFGMPLNKKNLPAIRKRLGLVFQNPDNQFVGASVRDDIAFGLENRAVPSEKMDAIIDAFSKKVGMYEYLDKAPENLSGGQKQRVAIAGILAMSPDLIIYDEATSMLDPRGKREILDLTFSLRKENPKLTVLSITHDVEEAYRADKVLVLNEGKMILFGTPEEVFAHKEELKKVHLALPFALRLKDALEEEGLVLPSDIHDLSSLEEFLCR